MTNNDFYISGKKLPEYPAQEEEVLLLEERVSEAKRLAQMVKLCVQLNYILYAFLKWAAL